MKIIGMALPHALILDKQTALDAGMNAFFLRPTIDQVSGQTQLVDVPSIRGGDGGALTATSLDFAQLRSQRFAYEAFVRRVLNAVVNVVPFVASVSSNDKPVDLDKLNVPSGFVAKTVTIEGTLVQVNHVLRKVYVYAADNSNGDAKLTIEARDSANYDCIRIPRPLTLKNPLYTFMAGSNGNESLATLSSECAEVSAEGLSSGYARTEIPLRVIHINAPPEVSVPSASTFITTVDVPITLSGINVADSDNDNVLGFTSFGFEQSAPITVTLFAKYGRLSLKDLNGLSLFVGRGMLDYRISFRGRLSVVNAALQYLQYVCRSADGCDTGYTDVVTVTANDEGFFGKGGPLSASGTVKVVITAA